MLQAIDKPTRQQHQDEIPGSEPHVPRPVVTLDAWAARDWSGGCEFGQLLPMQLLSVRTCNTAYELLVLSPTTGEVLIQGGRFFPVRCPARLVGSSLGGSVVKLRWLQPGFGMELYARGQSIRTSQVQSIDVAGVEDGWPGGVH